MTNLDVGIADDVVRLPDRTGRPAKRSFSIRGHRTSISIEAPFWEALTAIALERNVPVVRIVSAIDAARGVSGLSSAIRVFVLQHYRDGGTSTSADHHRAGPSAD